jgi:aromatic ring hydroxylase
MLVGHAVVVWMQMRTPYLLVFWRQIVQITQENDNPSISFFVPSDTEGLKQHLVFARHVNVSGRDVTIIILEVIMISWIRTILLKNL